MNLAFVISVLLVLGVVFVNGWTDAPNAIGSAVATKVLRPRSAIIVAVIFNFLGVLLMTFISTQVADTITNMVDFGPAGSQESRSEERRVGKESRALRSAYK